MANTKIEKTNNGLVITNKSGSITLDGVDELGILKALERKYRSEDVMKILVDDYDLTEDEAEKLEGTSIMKNVLDDVEDAEEDDDSWKTWVRTGINKNIEEINKAVKED